MLQVSHLTCGYGGEPVCRDISFRVRPGEHLCILGPNGSGKSTLLRALAGLIPCEGSVELEGRDLTRLRPRERARALALLAQFSSAAFDYTVYETVMLGRYARQKGGLLSATGGEDRQAVRESMERSGVWELRDRSVLELSGGQLQRVFLARTFAQDPGIIALDEPTNHLDLRCQMDLLAALRAWSGQGRRCVVAVLHDISLALNFADTVLLLEEGRVLALEPRDSLDLSLLDRLYGLDVRKCMRGLMKPWT